MGQCSNRFRKGWSRKSQSYDEYIFFVKWDIIQIGPFIDSLIESTNREESRCQLTDGSESFEVIILRNSNLILLFWKSESDPFRYFALMRKPAPKIVYHLLCRVMFLLRASICRHAQEV